MAIALATIMLIIIMIVIIVVIVLTVFVMVSDVLGIVIVVSRALQADANWGANVMRILPRGNELDKRPQTLP